MNDILIWSQIVISVLLIMSILLQQRGAGGSGLFGGTGEAYQQRRGIERFMFIATVVLAVLFLASALTSLILK
ncbi:MAG: preprotein translocase subunit SecG [Patescibacteria group bacterium]